MLSLTSFQYSSSPAGASSGPDDVEEVEVEPEVEVDVELDELNEAAEVDEKNAEKSGHTTPLQAAKIAKEAQVKNLVLIHRPEFDTDLINNIKNIFPNTIFPNDFDIIEQ